MQVLRVHCPQRKSMPEMCGIAKQAIVETSNIHSENKEYGREDKKMCEKAYAVRIVEYTTSKGPVVVITFSDEAAEHLKNATYYKAWAKGHRLYFIPSAPNTGKVVKAVKLCDANNTLMYYSEPMIEALRAFVGEYSELKYDSSCTYEYVDIADKQPVDVDAGIRLGMQIDKKPKKAKAEKAAVVPVQQTETATPEKEETKEMTEEMTADNDKQLAIIVLKNTIVDYVLSGNQEAAQAVAKVVKLLEE